MQLETWFRSLDGLRLVGTVARPDRDVGAGAPPVLMLHGNDSTREEFGLFTRLAAALAGAGVASLRFDLRAHGASEGRHEDRTLTAHLNDMEAGLAHLRAGDAADGASLVATSFSGGLAAWYAAHRPAGIDGLVLLNAQLDHRSRFVDEKSWWVDGRLDDQHARLLDERGYLEHSPTVRTGRALLNEVFWLRARDVLNDISVPTLLVHGTADPLVPIESSRFAARRIPDALLVEVEGAGHGFVVDGDPVRTLRTQDEVIGRTVAWLCEVAPAGRPAAS